MAQLYRIRPGCTFRVSGDQVKGEGEEIELEDDVAAMNREKVDALPTKPAAAEHQPSE